jgi:hypothetical protein
MSPQLELRAQMFAAGQIDHDQLFFINAKKLDALMREVKPDASHGG